MCADAAAHPASAPVRDCVDTPLGSYRGLAPHRSRFRQNSTSVMVRVIRARPRSRSTSSQRRPQAAPKAGAGDQQPEGQQLVVGAMGEEAAESLDGPGLVAGMASPGRRAASGGSPDRRRCGRHSRAPRRPAALCGARRGHVARSWARAHLLLGGAAPWLLAFQVTRRCGRRRRPCRGVRVPDKAHRPARPRDRPGPRQPTGGWRTPRRLFGSCPAWSSLRRHERVDPGQPVGAEALPRTATGARAGRVTSPPTR